MKYRRCPVGLTVVCHGCSVLCEESADATLARRIT